MVAVIPWWGWLLITLGGLYALYFVLFIVLAGLVFWAHSKF